MKKCNVCNKELPDDSVFCQYCGSKDVSDVIEVKRCTKCGKELPKDSNFCQYCGTKLIESTPNNTNRNNRSDGGRYVFITFGVVVFLVLVLIGLSNNISPSKSSVNNNSTQVSNAVFEPISGGIFDGIEPMYGNEITIKAPVNESCFVKLKTVTGGTRLSFYVRAGDTVTVKVPAEKLYVYFAMGKTWYGSEHLFGDYTSYSKNSGLPIDFETYCVTYELQPTSIGNFSLVDVNSDDF